MQQNRRCSLCSDIDETINHIKMQQSSARREQVETQLGGRVYPLGIVQEIKI